MPDPTPAVREVCVGVMVAAIDTLLSFSQALRADGYGAILNNAIAARDYIISAGKEIAEMRAVLGPKCPRCDGWLKASHWLGPSPFNPFVKAYWSAACDSDKDAPCITVTELLANHPNIAAEMRLTP